MNIQKLHISPSTPLKAAAAALILLAIAVSLTAYPLPAQAQASTDATLSALTVSPENIIGFPIPFVTSYEVGVASTVTEATIAATANDSNADVDFAPPDSNDATSGHQVALSPGKNTVTVTVTAEDTSTTKAYTVNINRGVTDDYGWNAEHDLDGLRAAGNARPYGIWANTTSTVSILFCRVDMLELTASILGGKPPVLILLRYARVRAPQPLAAAPAHRRRFRHEDC